MRVELITEGNQNPLRITNIAFDKKRSVGVAAARLYYTGASESFNTSNVVAILYLDNNGLYSFDVSVDLPLTYDPNNGKHNY